MFLGKVIGNVWATRKYEAIKGSKILFVQPVNGEYEDDGEIFAAIDTVDAGPGDIVIYITASEAVIPLPADMAPVDASIVGVVDSIYNEK